VCTYLLGSKTASRKRTASVRTPQRLLEPLQEGSENENEHLSEQSAEAIGSEDEPVQEERRPTVRHALCKFLDVADLSAAGASEAHEADWRASILNTSRGDTWLQ
jgi:hypothetical protein